MDANLCDTNHLDADAVLPPRKRLLAGLKKQNAEGNSHMPSTSCPSIEFDFRLNDLLKSHLNDRNLAQDEIVEASRSAAEAAAQVAKTARAAAEEKAIIAAKAMAAAKNALGLVAALHEEATCRERNLKNNKTKKQVQVKVLYNNKKQRVENCKRDEELARTLHRAINSSPRISKHCSPSSDSKGHRHKRVKTMIYSEKVSGCNGNAALEGKSPSSSNGNSNGNGVVSELNGGSSSVKSAVKIDEPLSIFNETGKSKMENGRAERLLSKEIVTEEEDGNSGRKRGRMKQKKLPLSICSFRDKVNPKEELKSRSLEMAKEGTSDNKPLSLGTSGSSMMPVERATLWKCQSFKAHTTVKQNKVMQS